jgi:Skp family chaperone for outer membrane proteins
MNPVILAILSISIAVPAMPIIKDEAPQFGTVRIAVVNIGQVLNQYDRAKEFKANLEKTLSPFKDEAARITKNIKRWEVTLQDKELEPASKAEYEGKIINARRHLEDMSRKIQVELGKKQEQNLITLWREVQMGIKDVATHHKIDVVFGYGDPMEKELLDLFPNINRKMQAMDAGSTVPLFVTPRADLTEEVVRNLNNGVRESRKAAPKGPGIDFE